MFVAMFQQQRQVGACKRSYRGSVPGLVFLAQHHIQAPPALLIALAKPTVAIPLEIRLPVFFPHQLQSQMTMLLESAAPGATLTPEVTAEIAANLYSRLWVQKDKELLRIVASRTRTVLRKPSSVGRFEHATSSAVSGRRFGSVQALQRCYDMRSLASTLGRNAAYFPGVMPSVLLKQRFK